MIPAVAATPEKFHHMGKVLPSKIVSCEFAGSFFTSDQFREDSRPQIAFAGRSNVGKSTLLNSLVGRKRLAKVSTTPGKTRSVNFFLVNDRFYFVDLPGYGYAKVGKKVRESWRQLIETYLTGSRHLIGLILLLDCRRDLTEEDTQLVAWLADRGLPVLAVVTKSDKLSRDKVNRKEKEIQSRLGVAAIAFSALTGDGKKELLSSIRNLVAEHFEKTRT
jgi:GTP-binding protein